MHEIVWLRPDRAGRGPRPARSRDDIAAVAVSLADAEGLEAVTMRRVAAAVGTGPASLYRYVATREQLVDLMVDAVGAGYDFSSPLRGDWLRDLLDLAGQQRGLFRAHPWLPAALATRPAVGPYGLRFLERAVSALRELPVSAGTKLEAVALMTGVVAALVQNEQAEAALARRAGTTTADLAAAQVAYLQHAVRPDEHPELTRLFADPAPRTYDDPFERIVGRVLTGLLVPAEPHGG